MAHSKITLKNITGDKVTQTIEEPRTPHYCVSIITRLAYFKPESLLADNDM